MQKKIDNNQEKDNTMNNSTLAPQAETETNVTGDVTEREGDCEMQNDVVAKEKKMNIKTMNIETIEKEIEREEENFNFNIHQKAFEICQDILIRDYDYDYTNLITKAFGEVDELTDKLYQEYLNSDEYNPEFPTPRITFREIVLMRGYHLYMANKFVDGDIPTEYSELCETIRQATEEFEDVGRYDADCLLRFPSMFYLVEYLQDKRYQAKKGDYDGETDCENNVVVAHLLQIWMFCDIIEALPQYMFNVYELDEE